MKKIGLTGTMGSGKSTLINILKEQGITVLDCDKINAGLLEKGAAGYTQLRAVFKNTIIDETQAIDRQKLSDLMFCDPLIKAEVEHILHPLIKAEIIRTLQSHQQEKIVVIEVPLLYEIGWESFFDEVWVVASEEAILIERLMTYRNIPLAEIKKRMAHQMPQAQKIAQADVVFHNNGNTESLQKQIYAILKGVQYQ